MDRPHPVLRQRADESSLEIDLVVVEEPLMVQVDGERFAVLMRTPGHDPELATGFLHAERIVRDPRDVISIAHSPDPDDPDTANVADVTLSSEAHARIPPERRLTVVHSACGVCGRRTIEEVLRTAPPIASTLHVPRAVLVGLPARLEAAQQVFSRTGGLHAAALFDATGKLHLVREDVGRHNAVDKVVGHTLLSGDVDLGASILMVSGRAGFEIVEKAVVAGIPIVCSVSAPSSLALDLAESAGVCVVGFLRVDAFNVYTTPRRITG